MNALDALWYDGKGSKARAARLTSPSPGVLRVEAGGEALEFAAAELRLSPRLGRMPRTLAMPGEGHLQLEDSPLLDAWLPTPSRIEAAADWLERRRAAALAAGAATVLGVLLFFQVVLPWMAGELAPLVPAVVERQASAQALALLDRSHLQPSRLPGSARRRCRRNSPTWWRACRAPATCAWPSGTRPGSAPTPWCCRMAR